MARKRNYAAEYARRKARARAEGYQSFWAKRAVSERRLAPSYTNLTEKEKATWHRAFQAVNQMEKGMSLSRAAKKQHITPATVHRYMGDKLEQRGKRWALTGQYLQGRALRVRVLTEEGYRTVLISNPATRSEYARYSSYVGMYYSGIPEIRQRGILGLSEYQGRTFKDVNGHEHPYITDRKLLLELDEAGKSDL